jgi:hypothetical protein
MRSFRSSRENHGAIGASGDTRVITRCKVVFRWGLVGAARLYLEATVAPVNIKIVGSNAAPRFHKMQRIVGNAFSLQRLVVRPRWPQESDCFERIICSRQQICCFFLESDLGFVASFSKAI